MIPRTHPLAGVREAYNAVFVEAEAAGQLMFYGRGAGGAPTARAVLGDLVAVGRNRLSGGRGPRRDRRTPTCAVRPMGETVTRYHISLDVADKAGVLAAVAQAFAAHDVSIETVRQDGRGDDAALVIVTHRAADAALAAVVEELRGAGRRARVAASCGSRANETTDPATVDPGTTRAAHPSRVARRDRGVPRRGCRSTRRRRSSRLARAARRSFRRRFCPSAPAASLLKVEGANPTGSFKDRGMTMAISQGRRGGRQGGHLRLDRQHQRLRRRLRRPRPAWSAPCWCPHGKIALGKLAQALAHGATLLQVDGNFDDCLPAGPRAVASTTRSRWSTR